ncbi:MAG: ATP-dependent zinc metalloprotease FtsH [Proteobacteria bacterium]|nr:ATP-dependent zinc metalloprotease FtsH [Pseudomonadota bacterium]MBU1686709.1 ATP-dependent zinc metalloprotease FtsH [Pseudomonadota bacterium]
MANFIRVIFVLGLLALVGGSGYIFWQLEESQPDMAYWDFLTAVQNGEVVEVKFQGGELAYTDTYHREFATYVPDVQQILPLLLEKKVKIYGRNEGRSAFWNLLNLLIPVALVLLVWFMMIRRQTAGEVSDFARDKASFAKSGRQVTFRDVTGIPEAKGELLELVDFMQNPRKYNRLGAVIPKGVLFQGPPGTGKTLLARAIAGEAGVPFFSISGSDFVEMFVGVGASRVRELFKEAKKNKPCIIFIDEIDAVGGHRGGSGSAGGQEERGQTLNALLVEMDGFGSDDNIIVLAATNRPDILDPALLRPGRFDRIINILPPDIKGRQKILKVHTRNVPLDASVDLQEVARSTPGFTGAELCSLVNEAALIAGRTDKNSINQGDFDMAKDRILMGVERKGLVISQKDKRTMAVHEAGHAIVAKFIPEADPLHKITIIPRGRAMGHTQQLPLQDRHAYSREYLRSRITILMGGRAAEEILMMQRTTGAEGDLQQAIGIATNMVCAWGMSDVVGPLAFVQGQDSFLGGPAVIRNYSEQTARLLDEEIKKLVEDCYSDAVLLLQKEKQFLEQLSQILLEAETLDREELDIIYNCAVRKKAGEDVSGAEECSL